MNRKLWISAIAAAAFVTTLAAQRRAGPTETPSWAPKPLELPKYTPPHKPHTRIADLKKRHGGKKEWSQVIVDDDHLHAEYIQSAPGSKVSRRFHPDTRAWWVVMEGQIRFDIEGQDSFVASRGSMVQVPMQTIYSMETVGDAPALRYQVGIAKAKTLYPQDVEPPKMPGFTWIPVVLGRRPYPYEEGNKPHINLHELAKAPDYRGGRFVHDDRAVANIIYGYEKNLGPLNPNDKGHYHPECSEHWLIMAGQIRYPIEGQGVVVAEEGDVVYVPIYTFHAPRFHGPGPSCRLAMNGFPNIAHLREAARPH
jgi:mannose-6-phosphate isomerase-like protein (cupin superfamily)